MLRGDHVTDRPGAHHRADLDRLDVGRPRVHPTAHGWIDRQVRDGNDELSGTGHRNRLCRQLPVGWLWQARGPSGEAYLVVGRIHSPAPVYFAGIAVALGADPLLDQRAGVSSAVA